MSIFKNKLLIIESYFHNLLKLEKYTNLCYFMDSNSGNKNNCYIYNMFNTRPWLYYDSSYTNKFVNTYIQGILDICGNVVLRNGGFSLPNGDVSMNGNLYVGKQATLIGDVSMNGNIWVGKKTTLIGDVSMNGNIWVGKQTTLVGDVSMNGNVWVGKKTTLIGDVSMNSNLYVGLDASFNRNIYVKGTTNVPTFTTGTINASTITLGGSDLQTTLDNIQTDITTLQSTFNSLFGYFVLACEYKGNFVANGWFSFGANIAGTGVNPQVVLPTCTLIGYRIEADVAPTTNTNIVVYNQSAAVVLTITLPTTSTVVTNTSSVNIPYTLGSTFRVRFGSTGAGGVEWRASFIFSTRITL